MSSAGQISRAGMALRNVVHVVDAPIGVVALHRPSAYQSNSPSRMSGCLAGVD